MKVKPIDRVFADHSRCIPSDSYKELQRMGLLEEDRNKPSWLLSNEEQFIVKHYRGEHV